MAQTPESANAIDLEAIQRNPESIPASSGQGLQKYVGYFMSRISGGAGWWKSPSPDLARALVGRPAGATLHTNVHPALLER